MSDPTPDSGAAVRALLLPGAIHALRRLYVADLVNREAYPVLESLLVQGIEQVRSLVGTALVALDLEGDVAAGTAALTALPQHDIRLAAWCGPIPRERRRRLRRRLRVQVAQPLLRNHGVILEVHLRPARGPAPPAPREPALRMVSRPPDRAATATG